MSKYSYVNPSDANNQRGHVLRDGERIKPSEVVALLNKLTADVERLKERNKALHREVKKREVSMSTMSSLARRTQAQLVVLKELLGGQP